jgi:hypothetical protein
MSEHPLDKYAPTMGSYKRRIEQLEAALRKIADGYLDTVQHEAIARAALEPEPTPEQLIEEIKKRHEEDQD